MIVMYKRMNYDHAELRKEYIAWQVVVNCDVCIVKQSVFVQQITVYTVCNLTHFIYVCQLSSYTVHTLKNFTSAFL